MGSADRLLMSIVLYREYCFWFTSTKIQRRGLRAARIRGIPRGHEFDRAHDRLVETMTDRYLNLPWSSSALERWRKQKEQSRMELRN